MVDILYSALIAPLEEGFLHALPALAAVTGSWGGAIILLSVIINLALLPFYRIADQWQQVDRDIRGRLKPKVDELKAAYTGDERFMMLRTLYRQAGYHPLLAIRSVAGVLMQIPVLLAAYYFLLDFGPIVGTGFGPLADLTRPDGLLRIGAVQVNLLPLAMTVINIASITFAAPDLAGKEKTQLWVIAFAFLALLYTMPSGLVLFWTTNNVFSLIKGLASSRVPSCPPGVWIFFETAPICVLFVALVALDPYTLWLTQTTLGVQLALACFLYAVALRLLRTARFRPQDLYGLKRLVPVTVALVALLAYAQASSTYRHNLVLLVMVLFLAIGYFALATDGDEVRSSIGLTVTASSVALSAILLVFNPLLMYFSSPTEIGTMNGLMMVNLVLEFAIASFLLIKVQTLMGRFVRAYAVLLAWAATATFAYSYVAIRNYGLLRGGRFTEELVLLDPSPLLLPIEVILLAALGVTLAVVTRKFPTAVPLYLGLVLSALTVNLAVAGRAHATARAPSSGAIEGTPDGGLPTLFSFGGDRNILLIVPDAALGPLLPDLVQEDPTLEDGFRGFVYYGNTAAVGTFTMSNTAALLGGPRYTPPAVNARAEATLAQVVSSVYEGLFTKLEQNRYAIRVMDPSIVDCADLPSIATCDVASSLRDLLYERYGFETVRAFDKRLLFLLSAFKASPLAIKSTLYRSSYWETVFSQPPATAQSERYYESLFVRSLPQLSEAGSHPDGRAFMHLWLNDLIAPFFLDAKCNVAYRAWSMWNMEARRDSTLCLLRGLARWFDWMRQNGVYDNTKIIIAADHGAAEYGDNWYRGAVTPLLMVKDFGEEGALRSSNLLMSNSDVLPLICSGLARGCEAVPGDPTGSPRDDRVVSFSVTTHGNPDFARSSREFDIVREYEIRGSVHDVAAWQLKEPPQ